MTIIKLDLHLHTIYSGDSLINPSKILPFLKRKNIDGLAICDHDTLKGYYKLKKIIPKQSQIILIPGMEIETNYGEVIALFIQKEISLKNPDFFCITDQIRDQGGVVIIPHPFDFLRRNRLNIKELGETVIGKHVDGVEIINSRIIFPSCIKKAKKLQNKFGLFETGGSDAHTYNEIGNGYTLITKPENSSLDAIKQLLLHKKSQSDGKLSSPLVHATTVLNKLRKRIYF